MTSLNKPAKVQPGDKVATISLSWGGAYTFPHRYESGKARLQQVFGLEVVETPHATKPAEWLYQNPKARAEDLLWAFEDKSIKGIFSIIGGEDSIRTLPFLDLQVIKENPKVFMGLSDTTVTHFALRKAGLVSFYGTSVMMGFAENVAMFNYEQQSIQKTLFDSSPIGELPRNNQGWTSTFVDWANPDNNSIKRPLTHTDAWLFLQGNVKVRGQLLGGCLEVLELLKATHYWPAKEEWQGKVLFLETSEEMPSPSTFRRIIWNYAAQGIFNQITALLLGRPYDNKYVAEYEQILLEVIGKDVGLPNLPIVSRLDFGHTSPSLILPMSVDIEIDCKQEKLFIPESAVL
jgi:muramoyltetrapeptide carboxypeptidase LdcA involved in peptidoglycan recycling